MADMLQIDVSRVYRWTYPRDRGGGGGLVPAKHQVTLLRAAAARGILLAPADFFPADYLATPSTAVARPCGGGDGGEGAAGACATSPPDPSAAPVPTSKEAA